MRRSDPLTLTITVLSTVAVTSGLTLGLSERYVTSCAFYRTTLFEYIAYGICCRHSYDSATGVLRIFYDCMYNCKSNILSLRLSIVLYIGLGLAHALGLA